MRIRIEKKELLKKIRHGPIKRNLSTRVHENIKRYKRSRQKRENLKAIKEGL